MKVNNKKKEITDVAYKLFIKKGYENTSVDEIIKELGIAKGTFYYYFETKEELLENVINEILDKEVEAAIGILNSNLPLEQKIVGIIVSMRPTIDEKDIKDTLNKPENILMHKKINDKVIHKATPLISKVVEEGIKTKTFNCDNVEERVKLLLIISSKMFDTDEFTKESIHVFIDTIEKTLGAKKDSMKFIINLINGGK